MFIAVLVMQLNSTGPPQGTQVLLGTTWKAENVDKTMVATPNCLQYRLTSREFHQVEKKHRYTWELLIWESW